MFQSNIANAQQQQQRLLSPLIINSNSKSFKYTKHKLTTVRAPVRRGGLSAWNKRKQNYLLIFTSQQEKTAMRTQQWAITVTTELVSDFLFYLLHGRGFSARQPASTHANTTKSFIFEESADFLTGSCKVSVALEPHFLIYADRWPDRPRGFRVLFSTNIWGLKFRFGCRQGEVAV